MVLMPESRGDSSGGDLPHDQPFRSDEHMLVVKNTFIDVVPRPEELNRSQSAPVGGETANDAIGQMENRSGHSVGLAEYGGAVHAPTPLRKLSEEQATDLGLKTLTKYEEPFREPREAAASSLGEQYSSPAVESHVQEPSTGGAAQVLEAQGSVISEASLQAQTIHIEHDSTGVYKVTWTVDARKLISNEKQAVSPPFGLYFDNKHDDVKFKMMIIAADRNHASHEGKGNLNFKKTSGQGIIQLKCEGDLAMTDASVMFQLGIGNASGASLHDMKRPPHDFEAHSFAQSAVCGLPKVDDVWNFRQVVHEASKTFNVHVTIKTRVGMEMQPAQ